MKLNTVHKVCDRLKSFASCRWRQIWLLRVALLCFTSGRNAPLIVIYLNRLAVCTLVRQHVRRAEFLFEINTNARTLAILRWKSCLQMLKLHLSHNVFLQIYLIPSQLWIIYASFFKCIACTLMRKCFQNIFKHGPTDWNSLATTPWRKATT